MVNAKKKGKISHHTSHDLNQFPPDRKSDGTESRLQITHRLIMKGVFHLCLKTATIRDKSFD